MKIPSAPQLTAYAILAGIATHPIWAWSFKTTLIPKPSDFFFALAIAGSIIYFLGEGRNKLSQIPKLLYAAFFLFGLGIVLATMAGYIRYNIPLTPYGLALAGWHPIIFHLFRIGGGFILALFVYASLSESTRFLQRLSFAFLASAALFIPFLFLTNLAAKLGLLEEQGRFLGLAGNTGMFAILIFPAFVFALFFFLRSFFAQNFRGQTKPILFYGFLWLAVSALILWSGARSYFGAMVLVSLIAIPAVGYFYKVAFRKILIALMLIISALFVSLLFSPTLDKFKDLSRYPDILKESAGQALEIERQTILQTRTDGSGAPQVSFPGNEARLAGFLYYLSLLKRDPLAFILGVGINNEQRFGLLVVDNLPAGRIIIFDVFLYGGVLAFASALLFAWLIWRRIMHMLKMRGEAGSDPIYILAPTMTLLGWWTAAIFLGTPFTLIPNWILLAMALGVTARSS